MAWHKDENGDLVWDSVEKGIAPSPLKGTANIQNANIATETGEVMASFGRTKQDPVSITNGTLTQSAGVGSSLLAAPPTLNSGEQITISSSSIQILKTAETINYLAIAAGGGGAGYAGSTFGGGGGGGGGYTESSGSVQIGAYAVTVGSGGAAGAPNSGTGGNGGDSTIVGTLLGTVTAPGGGGGGGLTINGVSGGSGGGAARNGTGGSATSANGHAGATGTNAANMGSGGGGAGTAGTASANATTGGAGGNGKASTISGASVTYAGGGGGAGSSAGTPGLGGSGGGGAGGPGATGGTANTGGGGGGASASNGGTTGGTGIVIISYPTGNLTATGGSMTTSGGNTIHTFTTSGTFTITAINTTQNLPAGTYYVDYKNSSNQVKLSYFYDPYGLNPIVFQSTGTATFSTFAIVGSPLAKATETFSDGTVAQNRYYILDANGYVWVYDTAVYASTLAANGVGVLWMLPDVTNYSSKQYTGIGVINGWLFAFGNTSGDAKPTVNLGSAFSIVVNMINPFPTHINFVYTGHQGKLWYTDANYVGEIFPTTSFVTSNANIQSFASYTAVTTTGTMTAILSGSIPTDTTSDRIPAVFFTDQYGTQPTNLTAQTVYYIESSAGNRTFRVYAAASGGSAIDIQAGAVGKQYFNTFYVLGSDASAGGTHPLLQITQERVNLPSFEIAQCIIEVGNTVIIGCKGNTLYPWNEIDATPSDLIALPEADVKTMINVNNIAYVFAGNKGNIYVTNNSVASLVTKVPDYCAGIAGTPNSYIEPSFVYGDAAYIRGRIYFSILDQTTAKAGNCGGVWSFIPSQNVDVNQDIGIALRLENQNSYGTYNGLATVILPNANQLATAPQYWTGWYSNVSAPVYGIDVTEAFPTSVVTIETDLVNIGTLLNKKTLSQIEYKLSTPLVSGESVGISMRFNATEAYTSLTNVVLEPSNPLSGYFEPNQQTSQWVQFKLVLTPLFNASTSFIRLVEMRIR